MKMNGNDVAIAPQLNDDALEWTMFIWECCRVLLQWPPQLVSDSSYVDDDMYPRSQNSMV